MRSSQHIVSMLIQANKDNNNFTFLSYNAMLEIMATKWVDNDNKT